MCQRKISFAQSVCLFVLAMLWGCAAPALETGSQVTEADPGEGYVYHPKLQSGALTADAAKSDLGQLLRDQQGRRPGIRYDGPKRLNDKEELERLVKGARGSVSVHYGPQNEVVYILFTNISVLNDKIELSPQLALYYADLIENDILVEKSRWPDASLIQHYGTATVDLANRPYRIHFPGLMSFHFQYRTDAERFADDLFAIRQPMNRVHDAINVSLESRLSEYRALRVKPAISEDQRKLIVQANAMGQQKEYRKAIDLYLKALELDPVSYPAAYFNTALLYGQERRFKLAISYMKKYLLLEPDAKDARSAQDKIYEWELMLKQ